MINKFTAFGEAVVAASLLVLECPDNTIHLGPAIKGLLPGIYKVANHNKVLKKYKFRNISYLQGGHGRNAIFM